MRSADGLYDVSSSFKGFSAPLPDLINDLHRRGWTLHKLYVKDGHYLAIGKNPHKEELQATGVNEATAVGNLIIKVMRREHMRSSAVRERLGAWDAYPIEQQLNAIAQAYAGAPVYEPKAAVAWMDLAQDFHRRADIVKTQITIEYTYDPTPYESADDLREDVTKKRHITLTRSYAHHPVWSESQMLDYRLCVDVLGHTLGGADWGWHGTCLAFAQLAPLLAEEPQKALFTELLGQTAFGTFYRQWGPQKICFLNDLVEKEQAKENKPGHSGVHPSQSIVPSQVPHLHEQSTFSKVAAETRNQMLRRAQGLPEDQSEVVHEWPDGWTVNQLQTYGDMYREGQLMSNCFAPRPVRGGHELHDAWSRHPEYQQGWVGKETFDPTRIDLSHPLGVSEFYSLRDPDNIPHVTIDPYQAADEYSIALGRHNSDIKPEYAQRLGEWADEESNIGNDYLASAIPRPDDFDFTLTSRMAAVVGAPKDPNQDWESGVSPLQDNAYLWQRQNDVDPLDIHTAQESLRPLEAGISNMHPQLVQQAVANALRGSLLGARQSPRGHAIHYQTLMSLPAGINDPMAYHDVLDQAREHWNQGQGYAAESHKQYWAQEQQFKQWVKSTNPHLDDGEVNRLAKREMAHMMTEEEERIIAADQGEQMTTEMIEHEAFEAIKNRLAVLTKPNPDQKVDFGDSSLYHEATHHADMYPPFLTSRTRALAQLGQHANTLAEAAREDLMSHRGHGHHFRATALSLGVPGLGPRQVSNAWLHLAPQTSQLGIINPEIADVLGHDYADMSNRDYFKLERELAAGRDAAGYGHIPLGGFSTAMWDLYSGGPGWHPDRTPFKVYSPTPHHTVDWTQQIPPATQASPVNTPSPVQ